MNRQSFLLLTLLFLGASAKGAEISVTEYGLPDMQGVWNFSTSTPLERPESFGETEFLTESEIAEIKARRERTWNSYVESEENISSRLISNSDAESVGSVNLFWGELEPIRENSRTSLIIHPKNGKIPPVQPDAVVQRGDWTGITEIEGERPVRYTHGGIARNGPEDRGLSERCLVFNSGPPLLSGPYNNNIQIIQNSDHVAILVEMGFDARIIPLEPTPHLHQNIRLWSGDSRGYFEGNTLIVETRNFTDQIASLGLRDLAYGSGEDRILTERFTLEGPNELVYEFTIDDTNTFTDLITATIPLTKTESQIFEYACHAGNYALANILSSRRAEESRGTDS